MEGSVESLNRQSIPYLDKSATGNSFSRHDLTSELIQIMEKRNDELGFDSHDLIEDQAGGPAAFSEGCGSMFDPDDKILASSPETLNRSLKKWPSDLQADDIDDNSSTDAKDILEKLEMNPPKKVTRSIPDISDSDLYLDDLRLDVNYNKTPPKAPVFSQNGENKKFGDTLPIVKLEKYRAMADPIAEESDDYFSMTSNMVSDWACRLRTKFIADLKLGAVKFLRDYKIKVEIVSDTMFWEKVKLTFSKLREVRRALLRHGLTKLLLFKDHRPISSLFSSRYGESRSIIEPSTGMGILMVNSMQRKKMVKKIAVNILNSSSLL